MKIVKPAVVVLDIKGNFQEIQNVVIDFEDVEYDLYTTIEELRLPSLIDGKESSEYEDVYTGLSLVGAIGSRVECSVKSAVQQQRK
jgi:hypothetical protein